MSETNSKTENLPEANKNKKSSKPKKTYSKEVLERARRIQAVRKAEEARITREERKIRIAKSAEMKKLADVKKVEVAKGKTPATKSETPKEVKSIHGNEIAVEPEYIDFAVTSRSYKTQLTRKFKERKFWVDPSPYEILSYIPGTIISVNTKAGKIVKEGEQLLILEAMKMQNRVDMPFTARIKKINVKAGEKIPKDFVMVELEAIDK